MKIATIRKEGIALQLIKTSESKKTAARNLMDLYITLFIFGQQSWKERPDVGK
jgi:hypothetical protein